MQSALERHEEALKLRAFELEQERKNFQDTQAYEEIYVVKEKERNKKENEKLKAFLDEQKDFYS